MRLVLAQALLQLAAALALPTQQLPGYFLHPHSIGPKSQQYKGVHKVACKSAASCPQQAAAACNATRHTDAVAAPFVCRSFSVMKEEAQLYFTDYNESYYVPHWTMWSLSDGPPHPVGPPPPAPGPPHGDESGREDYCAAKRLAFSYANKLLAAVDASDVQVKLHQVSDALQLETACRNTSDSPRRWDLLEQQEGLRQPSSGSGFPSLVSVYVDAAAGVDDEHSGGAPGAPMRTVAAALDRLRALRAGRTAPAELVLRGSAVHFVGGHPIALTAEDSFLTIRGHAGENPTLSAGVALALSWT